MTPGSGRVGGQALHDVGAIDGALVPVAGGVHPVDVRVLAVRGGLRRVVGLALGHPVPDLGLGIAHLRTAVPDVGARQHDGDRHDLRVLDWLVWSG